MVKGKNKSVVDKIWDIFASVKLAVVIFSLIALTSIVGTVVEQNGQHEKNIKILSQMFGQAAAPSIYTVLDKLGFLDMYHSWWFVTFLLLFATNLIICSIDRLPRIWKIVKEPIHALAPEHLDKMSIKRIITLKGRNPHVNKLVVDAMRRIGFKASEASEEQGIQFFAEKGNFTRLGVYLTHLSILIILAGAIIGVYFGFNAFLPLQEGETSSVAYAFNERETPIPFGFDIRCDDFAVDYYGDTDMPKAYRSWLTVFKNGAVVMQKVITVNDPLKYEGITFYQSSFGTVPGSLNGGIFRFRAVSKDGKAQEIDARLDGKFTIPGSSVEGHIVNFSPALTFDQTGKPVTYDSKLVNPAVYIEFSGLGSSPYAAWFFKRYPQTWGLPDGSRMEFMDYWGVQYTGLQVRKDPGVLLVYLGCIIMALGLYITFFMSHRRVWIHVADEKGNTKITVAASAHRNRAAFERRIEKVADLLQPGHKGGK
jgi:cytochrome c biogenesis protein